MFLAVSILLLMKNPALSCVLPFHNAAMIELFLQCSSSNSNVSSFTDLYSCIAFLPLGVIMFTTLPRQMFGLVQSKLFPKYFLCGTLCSSIALTTYAIHYPVKLWLDDFNIQVTCLQNYCNFHMRLVADVAKITFS